MSYQTFSEWMKLKEAASSSTVDPDLIVAAAGMTGNRDPNLRVKVQQATMLAKAKRKTLPAAVNAINTASQINQPQ